MLRCASVNIYGKFYCDQFDNLYLLIRVFVHLNVITDILVYRCHVTICFLFVPPFCILFPFPLTSF